jgi:fucose permease
MSLITKEKVAAVTKWLHEELWPELQLVFLSNPYMKYLLIVLVILILLLIKLKKKSKTQNTSGKQNSVDEPKNGFKNFKGDVWYPDGRVWHKDKESWEDPDYPKK